jgi:hypothetical protein
MTAEVGVLDNRHIHRHGQRGTFEVVRPRGGNVGHGHAPIRRNGGVLIATAAAPIQVVERDRGCKLNGELPAAIIGKVAATSAAMSARLTFIRWFMVIS